MSMLVVVQESIKKVLWAIAIFTLMVIGAIGSVFVVVGVVIMEALMNLCDRIDKMRGMK